MDVDLTVARVELHPAPARTAPFRPAARSTGDCGCPVCGTSSAGRFCLHCGAQLRLLGGSVAGGQRSEPASPLWGRPANTSQSAVRTYTLADLRPAHLWTLSLLAMVMLAGSVLTTMLLLG